jgi:two-component system cell cycle sensor histidine kinase/response regulator CckA
MQPSLSHAPKSRRILVVEDEGLIAYDIASRLEALGHEVVATASTAKEALENASTADLVLMDIRIDGPVDGVQAADEIRQRFHVPVVFLTAHADGGTLERAKGAGAFGYIVKPLGHMSLNTSIELAVHNHRVERENEERAGWLRTILGCMGDAVVVTDLEGRVLMLNGEAEALTGCVNAEAHGQPIASIAALSNGDSGCEGAERVALAILHDAPLPLDRDCKLIARDGRQMPVEGSVAPVKAAGFAVGAVLNFHDVSARRWEERQLRHTQKLDAAGRLAAGVSTDYLGWLGIIRHQSENLLRQFAEYSPARTAVEKIQEAATAAEQVTRRLAAFGTRQVGHPEILSLNAILRKAAKLIESVARPSIELAIRPDAATCKIKGDGEQIEQAIMTMAMHACAAMPTGGCLTIETGNATVPRAGQAGSYGLLAITYTGDEPDPESLFEPSATGDWGLALSMVHTLVAEQGGYISAQAIAGGGCRFEMLLPRHAGPEPVAQPAVLDHGGGVPAILLVDDRERVRLQLHNFFEAKGYNLLEAADGDEAVAIARMHEGGPDVLIAEATQADAIAAGLGSGRLKLLRIVECQETGPYEIRRPFSQQTLLERVEALLRPRAELEAAEAG